MYTKERERKQDGPLDTRRTSNKPPASTTASTKHQKRPTLPPCPVIAIIAARHRPTRISVPLARNLLGLAATGPPVSPGRTFLSALLPHMRRPRIQVLLALISRSFRVELDHTLIGSRRQRPQPSQRVISSGTAPNNSRARGPPDRCSLLPLPKQLPPQALRHLVLQHCPPDRPRSRRQSVHR